MATNYAKSLPKGRDNETQQGLPAPVLALATTASDNATASAALTFNDNTTAIEVSAVGGAAVIKWIATSNTNPSVISAAGTANFDHSVPANTVRRFVVPIETQGVPSIVGANIQNGLYNRVAYKSVGVASVLLTQY